MLETMLHSNTKYHFELIISFRNKDVKHMRVMQAHESVASFASAYSLGKTESAAALNLMHHVPKEIKRKLEALVRSSKRP